MSLRTRLALLTAFAILAFAVAVFVAWRLARATQTFSQIQADSIVRNAARDLDREIQIYPTGYQTIDQALPGPPPRGEHEEQPVRPRPIPRHVAELFASYSDPLARLTAITLNRFPDVEGGFYRSSDGAIVGFASPQPIKDASAFSPSLIGSIRSVAVQAAADGVPRSRNDRAGDSHVVIYAYPPEGENMPAAWAMLRFAVTPGSDWPNIIAVLALAITLTLVIGLAFVTVRDLRVGVDKIEVGLASLSTDLNQPVSSSDIADLTRIAGAINKLTNTLRSNIARRAELETELQRAERLSALGRVVAGVAHEVRNPLSAIKLKVQMANRAPHDSEKLAQTFAVVLAEIERLDTLVRRLLDLGKQQTFERQPIDLNSLVRKRVGFFTDLAVRAKVLITIANQPTNRAKLNPIVEGDVDRLSQVIDNLIQNAFDAMPDGGTLTITCENATLHNSTPAARLRFDDTGPGISEPDREHIFEPFYTSRQNGTGLGLAIARSVVEEHGGCLSFVNRDGAGATFIVELPLLSKIQK